MSGLSVCAALCLGAVLALVLNPVLPPLLRLLGLQRVNYSGDPILTGAGLGFVLAALPLLLLERRDLPVLVALCAFAALGFLDDRWGATQFKGFRGHLGALRRGVVTSGLVKAIGGAAVALALGLWMKRGWTALPAALLIALGANLFNLLDLRPLRALKALWLLGSPAALLGSPVIGLCLGYSLPYARREGRREWMLGDTGSNALGAAVGCAAASRLPLAGQVLGGLVLIAIHFWAERHSLTAWIEAHSIARRIDDWGWRRR